MLSDTRNKCTDPQIVVHFMTLVDRDDSELLKVNRIQSKKAVVLILKAFRKIQFFRRKGIQSRVGNRWEERGKPLLDDIFCDCI
jgi:hypothetical protein